MKFLIFLSFLSLAGFIMNAYAQNFEEEGNGPNGKFKAEVGNRNTDLDHWRSHKLIKAIESNDSSAVQQLLLEGHLDVNSIYDQKGQTLLYLAVKIGNTEIVRMLIEAKANVNARNDVKKIPIQIPIHTAEFKDDKGKKVSANISAGLLDDSRPTPLYLAVKNRNVIMVQMLTAAGADVNINLERMTPLYVAVENGDTEIVRMLIEAGADVNLEIDKDVRDTALHVAAHEDIAQMLIEAGADIKRYRDSLISSVISHQELISMFIDTEDDVDAQNKIKQTNLYLSIIRGIKRVVKLLIDAGADANSLSKPDGRNSLHALARGVANKDIARILTAFGANIHAQDKWGETPLHYAVRAGSDELVRAFIALGADVNAQDNLGNTPLHIAANEEMVQILTEAGANIHAQNSSKYTPFQYAAREGRRGAAKALLKFGSDENLSRSSQPSCSKSLDL